MATDRQLERPVEQARGGEREALEQVVREIQDRSTGWRSECSGPRRMSRVPRNRSAAGRRSAGG